MASLELLVLRCENLERTRAYYEAAGLKFAQEQHGQGARHYSATLGTLVLELYPATPEQRPEVGLRLVFAVYEPGEVERRWRAMGHEGHVDPDGRIVVLSPE